MKTRRPRSAILAALLACLAVFCMTSLSSWHSATFHDDAELAQGISAHDHHDHGGADRDSDKIFHLAAHCMGQMLNLPDYRVAAPVQTAETGQWPSLRATTLTGREPASLQRPPQAA